MSARVAAAAALAVVTTRAAATDIELGRYLATECMTCHRAATAGNAIPNIFGMAEITFAEIVKGYRDGKRSNPVMQNIARRLTDEEIAALAAYFATAPKS